MYALIWTLLFANLKPRTYKKEDRRWISTVIVKHLIFLSPSNIVLRGAQCTLTTLLIFGNFQVSPENPISKFYVFWTVQFILMGMSWKYVRVYVNRFLTFCQSSLKKRLDRFQIFKSQSFRRRFAKPLFYNLQRSIKFFVQFRPKSWIDFKIQELHRKISVGNGVD